MRDAPRQSQTSFEALVGDGYVGSVDLGGTKILASIVGPDGTVVARAKKSTGKHREAKVVIDRIADCVSEAATSAGVSTNELRSIGIGAPGPVIRETGVVILAVNLDWRNVALGPELSQRLDVPVIVDNDVRIAVLAEHRAGAGRGTRNMIGLWQGTGIGGGLIVNGQIVTGGTNSAGEIGHITIRANGPVCSCGGRGHLEALASRRAITRKIAKWEREGDKTILTSIAKGDIADATSGDLAEAFLHGDKLVIRALDRAAKYLGIGIAGLANVLNPEIVVLGGGLIQALDESFVRQVEKKVKEQPLLAGPDSLRLVRSELGDDAGIVGGAILARFHASGESPVSTDHGNGHHDAPSTEIGNAQPYDRL